MTLTASPEPATLSRGSGISRPRRVLALLSGLWLILFFASLFAPPVLDDADGTHANAARQMALSGDWVTLRVNNVRYLEKAPLPYWIVASSFRIFGFNTFAAHLPQAIGVLLLMLLGVRWAREVFGERAALYTGLGLLTSAGVFLFTRVFIPDLLLSLLLATALYTFLKSLTSSTGTPVILTLNKVKGKNPRISPLPLPVLSNPPQTPGGPFIAPLSHAMSGEPRALTLLYPYALWTALALAILTKGLVALVFLFGTAGLYLALTGDFRHWRRLRPFTGVLLMLAIAAPWHILAGLRNTGGIDGHGFFWFYFINEHVLRFLGQRIPRDYNKLPGYLYWSLHLVWLFPWALFAPLWIAKRNAQWQAFVRNHSSRRKTSLWIEAVPLFLAPFIADVVGLESTLTLLLIWGIANVFYEFHRRRVAAGESGLPFEFLTLSQRTTLQLTLFSALVLLFFSLSTNQEYYTFPAYLPLLMLLAGALVRAESTYSTDRSSRRWITFAHAALTTIGVAVSIALAYGLWTSRHFAFVPDIGDLLAHRGVGDYTLSMSALFDLTGPSFAALRLPAVLAMAAFALGPAAAWMLRHQRRHLAATSTIALTSAAFLIAAHIALTRFAPMLSSQDMAATIQRLQATGQIARNNTLLLFGDQAYGSSIPFYLNRPLDRPALLVDGRSSSMLFGSTFPDAQRLFLTPAELLAQWGTGERKLLFVPIQYRDQVDLLLGARQVLLQETSGKVLITDRPLDR